MTMNTQLEVTSPKGEVYETYLPEVQTRDGIFGFEVTLGPNGLGRYVNRDEIDDMIARIAEAITPYGASIIQSADESDDLDEYGNLEVSVYGLSSFELKIKILTMIAEITTAGR